MAAKPVTTTVGLGENTVEVVLTPLRNRARARASLRLFRLVGPTLAQAVAKGGIEVNGKVIKFSTLVAALTVGQDETDEETRSRMGRIQSLSAAVIQEVIRAIDGVDPEDLLALGDDVLLGHCKVGAIEMVCTTTDPETRSQLAEHYADELFPDAWAYLDCVRQAVVLNILPSIGRRTDPGSSAAETVSQPLPGA